ncbi:MAG: hypothetical protein K6L73_13135 [Cellvibrionaceae bacterium]
MGEDLLGVSDIFGLSFSLMEFVTGIGQYTEPTQALRQVSKVFTGIFKTVSIVFDVITGIVDIWNKCKDFGFAAMAALFTTLVAILALGFLQIGPASKLLGFLIDTAVSKLAEAGLRLAYGILERDAGCK